MTSGFIKLYRSTFDHWLSKDKPYCRLAAWADLIALAAWQDHRISSRGIFVDVRRGQLWTTLRWLADRWGWDKNKVHRFIVQLSADGMIVENRDAERDTRGTLLTIINYERYQSEQSTGGTDSGTHTGHMRDTHGTHAGLSEEVKERKEGKERTDKKPGRKRPPVLKSSGEGTNGNSQCPVPFMPRPRSNDLSPMRFQENNDIANAMRLRKVPEDHVRRLIQWANKKPSAGDGFLLHLLAKTFEASDATDVQDLSAVVIKAIDDHQLPSDAAIRAATGYLNRIRHGERVEA